MIAPAGSNGSGSPRSRSSARRAWAASRAAITVPETRTLSPAWSSRTSPSESGGLIRTRPSGRGCVGIAQAYPASGRGGPDVWARDVSHPRSTVPIGGETQNEPHFEFRSQPGLAPPLPSTSVRDVTFRGEVPTAVEDPYQAHLDDIRLVLHTDPALIEYRFDLARAKELRLRLRL